MEDHSPDEFNAPAILLHRLSSSSAYATVFPWHLHAMPTVLVGLLQCTALSALRSKHLTHEARKLRLATGGSCSKRCRADTRQVRSPTSSTHLRSIIVIVDSLICFDCHY